MAKDKVKALANALSDALHETGELKGDWSTFTITFKARANSDKAEIMGLTLEHKP